MSTVIVKEPGTIRSVHYGTRRDAEGKYPVTYWGSVEEQIAEATRANAEALTQQGHDQTPLYLFADDCDHLNPEDDERFDAVQELIYEWQDRNLFGLTGLDGELHYRNSERAYTAVPGAGEMQAAQQWWDDVHSSGVCLGSQVDSCCALCEEYSLADCEGTEGGPCRVPERVRDEYDEFWYRASLPAARKAVEG